LLEVALPAIAILVMCGVWAYRDWRDSRPSVEIARAQAVSRRRTDAAKDDIARMKWATIEAMREVEHQERPPLDEQWRRTFEIWLNSPAR
jgi:hypothetical protein